MAYDDYGYLVPQFPDLTEQMYMGYVNDCVNKVKTEFMFFVKSMDRGQNADAIGLGYKPVATMNNWWPSHAGEIRPITLYWMRAPKGTTELQPVERKRWAWRENEKTKYVAIKKDLAASGCAFKIAEPPINPKKFFKYFSLLRMPLVMSPQRKSFLKGLNYRQIDTGAHASFWVNGWDPKTYNIEKEFAFFKTTQKEWKDHGEDGYRNVPI
jgi:hypothetical protein